MGKKILIGVLGLLLIACISVVASRRVITHALLFHPERGQKQTPAALGLAYQEQWVTTEDGVRIQTWWLGNGARNLTVVFFHGNAGNMAGRLDNAKALYALGVSVLLVEYRGYGDSEGTPSEQGLYADARAAVHAARARAPQNRVVVFGRSLGGAVAIDVATREPVDGLVAESTFTSLPELSRHASWIPFASSLVSYEFGSLGKMARVRAPVLIIHGDADELIPFAMGERLFAAATHARARRFLRIANGKHNGAWRVDQAAYWRTWGEFLDAVATAGE